MTFKLLFCALIVGVAVCDAYRYHYNIFEEDPSMTPYYRRAYESTEISQQSSTSTTESAVLIGGEYEDKSAKKSPSRYVVSNEMLSWYDASENCKNKGMVLASPSSPSEKRHFEEFIRENGLATKDEESFIWVNGHYTPTNDFQWLSNKKIIDNGWLLGEPTYFYYLPNPYDHSKKILNPDFCVELRRVGNTSGWNNNLCHLKKPSVCEPVISQEDEKNVDRGRQSVEDFDNKENGVSM